MVKVKPASIFIFLLVYVQNCLVVSQVGVSGFPEVRKNGGIIHNISQLVDDTLETGTEDRARDSLQSILPTYFSKLGETKRTKRSVSRSSVIIPWLNYNLPTGATGVYLLGVLDKISSIHQKIYVKATVWERMANKLDQLESGQKLEYPLKVTVYVGDSLDYSNITVALREKLRQRNVLLDNLDFGFNVGSQKPSWFESFAGGIPVICGHGSSSIQPSTALKKMRESCGFLFDLAAAFQWEMYVDYSLEFHNSPIHQRLHEALLARKEVRVVKPNVSVILKMYPDNLPSKESTFNFYCNETLLKINAYHEAIWSWARINDFPVVLYNIFPDLVAWRSEITWWSSVEVDNEISQDITKSNPVYVLRNFGGELPNPNWNVDSCVKWSAEVRQEGISLDRDLTGATLSMDVRKEELNRNELETLLFFTLHKFTTVELLLRNDAIRQLRDLKTLNTLMETEFQENLVDFDILGGRLYIEISIESTLFSEAIHEVEKLAERLSNRPKLGLHLMGVHLRDWESETSLDSVVRQVVSLGVKYNFKVGLVVKNCATLLNKLANSKNSTNFPPSEYILCLTKTFPAENENKEEFSRNFDTNLYMSKIFEKFLPGRSIYFRINTSPCCDGDTKEKETQNLFRFLNDVSQFAVGNKLKHFLVQAFTTETGSSSSSSWFHVENYTDLSDPSVFTDREEVLRSKSLATPLPPLRWIEKLGNTRTFQNEIQCPAVNSILNFQRTSNKMDLGNQASELNFPRKEVSLFPYYIPVGYGFSFQNYKIGVTLSKVFELEAITPSNVNIMMEVPRGLNVTHENQLKTCYKVFQGKELFLKENLEAFDLSPNSIPVEKFGKRFFQDHPCFNLISLGESPASPPAWNSLSATVDFIKFSIGLKNGAKLDPDFERDLSYSFTQNNPTLASNLLFKIYGTHVITRADFGGSILIQVKLRQVEDDGVKITDIEKLAILSQAIREISKILISATGENVTCLAQPELDQKVIYKLTQFGGNSVHYFSTLSEMNSVRNVANWRKSLEQFPVVLSTSFKLVPLDEVVSKYGTNVQPMSVAWITNALEEIYATANNSHPSFNPPSNPPTGNNVVDMRKSKMQCSREEVCPCRPLIPVGFGYSFRNHVILTQNKILQLEQVPHSEVMMIMENEMGFNVTRVDEWRSCYKVFRSQDSFLNSTMRAFGVSPTSFPVETFGKAVFQKHPCFNLIPRIWNSFSATLDYVTFSVGIDNTAKLEPAFSKVLSQLQPRNATDTNSDLAWKFLFELYGTHVVSRADLGGSIQIQLEVKEAEDDSEEIDEPEKLSILSKAVVEITLNLQLAERENATFLDLLTIDPRVTFTLSQFGGNPIHHFSNFFEMNSVKNVAKWRESLEQFPVILPTSLKLLPLDQVVSRYGLGVSTRIPTWIKNALGLVSS